MRTNTVEALHASEVASGRRFEFGRNWSKFLAVLDEERIAEAERSLRGMLGVERLDGKSFLDIGSGSGLFSLAARRMGARVHSFDFDPESVACTLELKRRYFTDDPAWVVQEGSVLDAGYVRSLGTFDVVYSWGVLHHTGRMWDALANASLTVAADGLLFIAIYNQQDYLSPAYTAIKRGYVNAPLPGKMLIAGTYVVFEVAKGFIKDVALLRDPRRRYRDKKRSRGMSTWHDWIDWIGGYPFETARPDEIFEFFRQREFRLERLVTCGSGHGCNEFVFRRG